MAEYKITSPTGETFRITAPEGASESDVLAYAKQNMPGGGTQAPVPTPAPAAAPAVAPNPHEAQMKSLGIAQYGPVVPPKPGPITEAVGMMVPGGAGIAKAGAYAASKGLPAVAGRLAASGALGAAKGFGEDDGSAAGGAVKGLAAGGVTEGALSALGAATGLNRLSGAARAFKGSGQGILDAIASLGPKYAAARVVVPTLGPQKMTAQEAAEQISKLTGPAFGLARDELARVLDQASKFITVGAKNAGDTIRAFTSDFSGAPILARTAPGGMAKAADTIQGLTQNAGVRAGADVLGQQSPEGTILMGASAPSMFGNVAGRLVGGVIGR